MEKVINLGIPHVGEQIFASIETPELVQSLQISEPWKILAKNVLINRWKGKMFGACISGETEIVQLLLENCIYSCGGGHNDVINLILNHPDSMIEVNAQDAVGCTALMQASKYGHNDVVQSLLKYSGRTIDFNIQCQDGKTAFIYACEHGNKEVVQLLLDQPYQTIDLNVQDQNGQTALMHASGWGHDDIVKLILA